MTSVTPTTELEAVNLMLGAIGESPVNSLDASGLEDVATAKSVLTEVSRSIQMAGWYFNTLKDYALVREPTAPYRINLPSNTISFMPYGSDRDKNLVQRGLLVYDADNHTLSFDYDIKAELIILLPFSDLPEAAKAYIAMRAARIFQQRRIGSQELTGYGEEEERNARTIFRKEAARQRNGNVLSGSYTVYRTLDRRSYAGI